MEYFHCLWSHLYLISHGLYSNIRPHFRRAFQTRTLSLLLLIEILKMTQHYKGISISDIHDLPNVVVEWLTLQLRIR
jgi:hypothetical protein